MMVTYRVDLGDFPIAVPPPDWLQVISQAEERAHYGKGSDQILIKLDKRLPDITAAL